MYRTKIQYVHCTTRDNKAQFKCKVLIARTNIGTHKKGPKIEVSHSFYHIISQIRTYTQFY